MSETNGRNLTWKWLAAFLLPLLITLVFAQESKQDQRIEQKADKEAVSAQYDAIIRQLNRIEDRLDQTTTPKQVRPFP